VEIHGQVHILSLHTPICDTNLNIILPSMLMFSDQKYAFHCVSSAEKHMPSSII